MSTLTTSRSDARTAREQQVESAALLVLLAAVVISAGAALGVFATVPLAIAAVSAR